MRGAVKTFSLDVTSRCNLRCAHCYNASGGSGTGDLTLEELKRVAGEIADFSPEGVCLCGGEPLLMEGVTEIMDVLRDKTESISMVSNGLLMTEQNAKDLKAHGLKAIQISLDGAFAWQHDSLRGRAGSFEAALRAIRALQAVHVEQVFVSMIPNKLNYRTLNEYFSLCLSLGISLLKFMPFMPMGRGNTEGKSLILDQEEMFRFQRQLAGFKETYSDQLRVEWDDPVRTARYLCQRLQEGKRPFLLSITANGDVHTDVYAPVTLGNVRKRTLKEIFETGIQEAREQGKFRAILNSLHEINDLGR